MTPFSFVVFADAHLGKRQYNSDAREEDFSRAWNWAVETITEKLEPTPLFALFGGDVFDRSLTHERGMNGAILDSAELGCRRINSKLPYGLYAVTGNHELASYVDPDGWVDWLERRDGLRQADIKVRVIKLDYNQTNISIAIGGFSWAGAQTPNAFGKLIRDLAAYKQKGCFTIGLAHAGLEGVLPGTSGVIPKALFAGGRGIVDCLAMGHIHKPYEVEYAISPGSLETCAVNEYAWTRRGLVQVFVDSDGLMSYQRHPYLDRRKFIIRESLLDTEEDIIRETTEQGIEDAVVHLTVSPDTGNLLKISRALKEAGALIVRLHQIEAEPETGEAAAMPHLQDELSFFIQAAGGDKTLAREALRRKENVLAGKE